MSEWKEYKLGELVHTNTKSINSDYPFEEIEYLDTGSITQGKIERYQKYKLSKAPTRAKRLVEKEDIIYSTVRPIQRHYGFIDNPLSNLVVSTGFVTISCVKDKIYPKFLYYFLVSDDSVEYLNVIAEASTSTYPSLKPSDIKNLDILLPPLSEQKTIASILSSLDDKIDLLHRQNATLEKIAETLFRQWFIEEAKEEWEIGKLDDVLSVIESGKRPKGGIDPELTFGVPSIGAENINGIGVYDFSKTKFITEEFYHSMQRGIIKDYDVLIYKDGAYVGRKGMFGNGFPFQEAAVNEHVFILRSNEKTNQFFLYFLLNQEELEQLNANSAQPGLNQEAIKAFEIIIPPYELMSKFGEFVKPFIDKIFFNGNQIRTLTTLRDTLLPKLMSGEIRVNNDFE